MVAPTLSVMHFSEATATTAAGVLPVFLIAYVLEIQRLRPTSEQVRKAKSQRGLKALLTGLRVLTALVFLSGAVIELFLLVVVEQGGASGAAAIWMWSGVVIWVVAPILTLAFTVGGVLDE